VNPVIRLFDIEIMDVHHVGKLSESLYERLDPERLRSDLASTPFSSQIVYREKIDSTNNLAKQMAVEGAPEGTLVLAEEQTGGRGRRGRPWKSPEGANLLLSVLLRPTTQADQVFVLTMILALAAIEAVTALSGLSLRIKWPNDLYAGMKKLSGILTEFSAKEGKAEWVVLGLGMNVNWYPPDLSAQATSILSETGLRVSRNSLLVEILKRFEREYREVLSGEVETFYRRWNEACFILGKPIEIESDRDLVHGKALRIDRDGALIIRTDQGLIQRVVAGDVSLRLEERGPSQ
jgi:BirA family biotin operon repressor/biotin-[acetyl-CoA-carboxylase] ligase